MDIYVVLVCMQKDIRRETWSVHHIGLDQIKAVKSAQEMSARPETVARIEVWNDGNRTGHLDF